MASVTGELESRRKFDEMMRVFRTAVRKAQAESRRMGVPNVYSRNGRIYCELPGSEITRTPPDHR